MLEQRSGHLIYIGSFAGRTGAAGQANYAAAKAGLIGLMQSLAREGGSANVRTNLVLPGVMDTPMLKDLAPQQRESLRASNVLNRFNEPGEVAHFIAFLAGLRHVSGQLFQLDSRITPWT
jgi:3-oxoacyl-[acyl-carrier protein] reductase